MDLDKIFKLIQKKVLKTHLPVAEREIQEGYLNSPCFQDVCLVQNKLPFHKAAIWRTKTLVERYLLSDLLLLKLNTTPGKESAVLAIPKSCTDRIIT